MSVCFSVSLCISLLLRVVASDHRSRHVIPWSRGHSPTAVLPLRSTVSVSITLVRYGLTAFGRGPVRSGLITVRSSSTSAVWLATLLYICVAGVPGDLYYVRNGLINDYALAFNLPLKPNVTELFFDWNTTYSQPPVSMNARTLIRHVVFTY